MKPLLALLGAAAVIGIAAPAHAYTSDDEFLATVQAAGIHAPDPQRAITAGRWVCQRAGEGAQMADLVKSVQAQNPGLSADNAAKFAAIAANVYCPNALGATSVKSDPS
jgi:hypothetical protein